MSDESEHERGRLQEMADSGIYKPIISPPLQVSPSPYRRPEEDFPLIYAAMVKVMAAVGPVGKGSYNEQQRYAFRGIDDVASAVNKAMAEHGVFCLPRVLDRIPEVRQTAGGKAMFVQHLEVQYTFYATDGSNVSAVVWGEASDLADKATNKAMSAAWKYALVQAFTIATHDMDDSEKSAEEATPLPPESDAHWVRAIEQELRVLEHKDPSVDDDKQFANSIWLQINDGVTSGQCTQADAKRLKDMIREWGKPKQETANASD